MTRISFEYFPPRSDGQRQALATAHKKLLGLNPEYCSVTFGAGGTSLDATEQTISVLRKTVDAAPHLSCRAGDERELTRALDHYANAGIGRIVALRGDRPSGDPALPDLKHASDLVRLIRRHTGERFRVTVACYPEVHPEAKSASKDLDYFVSKVQAGADEAITQYFFNADAYFRFVDQVRNRGLDIPIVPGIMPISNYAQLARFSNLCGAEIPRWLAARLSELDDDRPALVEFGLDVMTSLCSKLVENGAPALHFYTLNRAGITTRLCQNLGLAAHQEPTS